MDERYLVAGRYRLDVKDQRLWIADAPAALGGKALALLIALMESPQTLLTKDELLARVWPGIFVSESVLTTAVKEVRKALGDNARDPRVIETVHGRGYRFLLPVERTAGPPADAMAPAPALAEPGKRRPPRSWLIGSGAVLVLLVLAGMYLAIGRPSRPAAAAQLPHPKSVAVLPFDDLSPGAARQWFADGLTEEIQNGLARTPDLRVASRSSAARFDEQRTDARAIGKALGVAHVLQGTVRESQGRVRVRAELIRAADGFSLWSQSYDRSARDSISIQEDIAFRIAESLETVLEPARLRAMVAAGTRSVEAYEAFLAGRSFDQRQFAEGDVALARRAAEAYERARTLDPGFAEAHWEAARTWFGRAVRIDASVHGDQPEPVRFARYLERVDRAIATSGNDIDRLRYQAGAAIMRLQFREAHRSMARYLAERPRDIDGWENMGEIAAYAGERAWMRRAAERVHRLSMAEGSPRSRAITLSVMAVDLPAAYARAREQLRVNPEKAVTQYQAHRAFVWAGDVAAARRLLVRIRASGLPEQSRLNAELRQACVEQRSADAARLRARLVSGDDVHQQWQIAQTVGDTEAAKAALRDLDRPERLPTLLQFLIDPTFDSRHYPVLNARLIQNGIARPPAIATPGACRPAKPVLARTTRS